MSMHYCLGRLPARHDPRTLRFADFTADMPDAPESCNWASHVPNWPMFVNNRIGDCALASAGHLMVGWTANALGTAGTILSDVDIIAAYSAISGYDPRTGKNDNGCVMLDVLRYWSTAGIGGHKIHAYAAIDPDAHAQHKRAIWAFGGSYLGLDLPLACQDLLAAGKPWDLPANGKLTGKWAPGSWGGHAVAAESYDPNWLTIPTWAQTIQMSWRFLDAYCSEAWAVFSAADWIRATNGLAPNGFDHARLDASIAAVAFQPPVIGPEPTPPPAPTPAPDPTAGMSILVRDLEINGVHFGGTLYPIKP